MAEYLNWLMIERMPGGYQQHDRMLFRLPLSGACFKKIYFCPKSSASFLALFPLKTCWFPTGRQTSTARPELATSFATRARTSRD